MIAEYLMTLPEKACVSPVPTGSGGVVFSMSPPSEALHSLLVPELAQPRHVRAA